MEEFTISEPGVVTLHTRGRIQDVCCRLKYEENVTIECHPVHVPDSSPPLSPLHPQRSRLKSVECVEGDWSFIRIDKGDIALQQVDVIVNRIRGDLKLSSGPVSKALLQAAGASLQDECDKYQQEYGELVIGDILVTSGGELCCQYVFHVNLPLYADRSSLKVYREVIEKCLCEADNLTARSIAFPLMGVSTLFYPPESASQELLDKCIAYYRRRQGEVKQFHFVAISDKEYQAMNRGLAKRLSMKTIPLTMAKKDRSVSEPNNDGENERPILLNIVQGDVVEEHSDAIVNITNETLDLSLNRISCSILDSGGEDVKFLCERLVKNDITLSPGKVISTKSGDLPCKRIFHILDPCIAAEDSTAEYVEYACLAVLGKAEEDKTTSLSIPLLAEVTATDDICNAMIKACKQFSQRDVHHVEKITIVLSNSQEVEICRQQLCRVFPSFSSSIKLPFNMTAYGKTDFPDASELSTFNAVHFVATGPTKEAVQHAREVLESTIRRETSSKSTNFAFMAQCTNNDIQRLQSISRQHGVKIKVYSDSFTLTGDSHAVLMAETAVLDYLHSLKPVNVHSGKWQRIVNGKCSDIDPEVSAVIEQQHSKGTEKICVHLDNPVYHCIFDLKHMVEIDIDTGDSYKINRLTCSPIGSRTNTGLGDLPAHWDPQPIGANGKPDMCHVVTIPRHSQEYKDALQNFQNSLPPSACQIIELKRIQNPHLYQQYSMMKALMKYDVSSDCQLERQLYHGTNKAACEPINHQGFNRTFAGKNATYYGKGVYFAVDADYSSQECYSPQDENGYKYIYICQVLTGEYTKGGPDMVVPPAKNPDQNKAILYNSLVDNEHCPRIFVAVKDNQVYPQYLVICKMKF